MEPEPSSTECEHPDALLPEKGEEDQLYPLGKDVEPLPETLALENLYQFFVDALSSNPERRRDAESNLTAASRHPLLALALLRVVAATETSFSSSPYAVIIDDKVCHAAAVRLKNYLRASSSSATAVSIPKTEKQLIKTLIFCLSLSVSSPPAVQSLLGEALAAICGGSHDEDYPESWHKPLHDLVLKLRYVARYDYPIALILGIAESITSKFQQPNSCRANSELFCDLMRCFENLVPLIVEIFSQTAKSYDSLMATTTGYIAASATKDAFQSHLESQWLCYTILSCKNLESPPSVIVCILEFLVFAFTGDIHYYLAVSMKYLLANYQPPLEQPGTGNEFTLVDELRAAVCEHTRILRPYLADGIPDGNMMLASTLGPPVIAVLEAASASASSSHDWLIVNAIRFLIDIFPCYNEDGVRSRVLTNIIIPNMHLSDEDEELFGTNPDEFIRRDMDTGDGYPLTRRGIAHKLLRVMATDYEEQVTSMVWAEMTTMVYSFTADPIENWKKKDCAISLVIALMTGGYNDDPDLSQIKKQDMSIRLVQGIFKDAIIPELQSQDVNELPMLKAGALKFITIFHNEELKLEAVGLFLDDVARFLDSKSSVVRAYAKTCIDKLLLVRDVAFTSLASKGGS